MADGVTLLFLTLITYRISTDVTQLSGPFGLFEAWRGWAITTGSTHGWPWLIDGATCPICASFWIALVVTLIAALWGAFGLAVWVGWWLATAGAAAFLVRLGASA